VGKKKIKIKRSEKRKISAATVTDNIVADKWAAVIYFALIILVTWPLIINLNSIVPGVGGGGGDTWHFLWDMWWVKHSFWSGESVFVTDWLFYPNGVSLVYHTLILGQSLLALPWLTVFPLVGVFNVFYIVFFWLAAMFTFWLARSYWKNPWAAWVAGLVFAFSPYMMAHSLGHFNLTAIWIFPAWFFFVRKHENTGWWIWLVGAGLIMSFALLNDYQYFVFLLLAATLYWLYRAWCSRRLVDYLRQAALVFLIVFVIGFPVIWYGWQVMQTYLPGALLSEVSFWSTDLFSYLIPSWQHPIWGDVGSYYNEQFLGTGVESVSYLGFTVIGLLVVGFFWGARKLEKEGLRFWQISLIIWLVLSLGPFLKIMGEIEFNISDSVFQIVLPYLALFKLPLMTVARVPARFYVLVSLSSAMMIAYVIKRILQVINNYAGFWKWAWHLVLIGFFSVLILTEYVAWPFRFEEAQVPPVYAEIVADEDEFTVLELPLWWTSGHRTQGDPRTIIQYYQTYHGKKILNGSVSRVPEALFDYYQEIPGVKYLLDIGQGADKNDLNAGLVLYTWRQELDVRYIVLHKEYFEDSDYFLIRSYLENKLNLEIIYEDDGEVLYFIGQLII